MTRDDHKKISNILPIASLVFLLVIVLALISLNKPEYEFKMTTDQAHELIQDQSNIVVSAIDASEILLNNDSLYRFIDLRSPAEYLKAHLPGAINIPVHRILEKENQAIFNQDKVINVLYTNNHCDACGPWLILSQLGYKNNKILQGGFNFAKANIIDQFSPLSGNYRNEKAKYDFAEIVRRTAGNTVGASETQKNAEAPTIVIPKKKQAQEEVGGC